MRRVFTSFRCIALFSSGNCRQIKTITSGAEWLFSSVSNETAKGKKRKRPARRTKRTMTTRARQSATKQSRNDDSGIYEFLLFLCCFLPVCTVVLSWIAPCVHCAVTSQRSCSIIVADSKARYVLRRRKEPQKVRGRLQFPGDEIAPRLNSTVKKVGRPRLQHTLPGGGQFAYVRKLHVRYYKPKDLYRCKELNIKSPVL